VAGYAVTDSGWGFFVFVGVGGVDDIEQAGTHGLLGQVATPDLPLVVLFGEHGADEADHGVAVGQDGDHVGAAGALFC
jgi:hypothetical protein